MAKTTLEISDPLLLEARREAERTGTTLRAVIETALMHLFAERKRVDAKQFRLRHASVAGEGIAPGRREGDWPAIRRDIYAGRGEPEE
jgi:hypothetical protein